MQAMPAPSRQSALIAMNIRWLRQALSLLERLDDATYATPPKALAPNRAGAHLRHIVEFYQCFLEGMEWSHIDYDARRRDGAIEQSREAAAAAIRTVIRAFESSRELRSERMVWVRMEETEWYAESSISRELHVLSSHTIHHFALIAVTLRMHGVEMDPDFGMAPSTLRYLAAQSTAKTTAEAA